MLHVYKLSGIPWNNVKGCRMCDHQFNGLILIHHWQRAVHNTQQPATDFCSLNNNEEENKTENKNKSYKNIGYKVQRSKH